LVCHFLIKLWSEQNSINLTVGGRTPDGEDATNDLSYLFLEGMEATEMTADFSVRLHQGAPPPFVRTVMRVMRRGFGRPDVYNDEVMVEALTRKGVALEDARDYAPLGCVEIMIPGRTAHRTMCMGLNLPKVLELVLNGGRCLVTGEPVWDDVPAEFAGFDALVAAYHARVRQVIALGVEIVREDERLEPTVFPRPWLTVLSRGGIESGVDMTAGQPKYDPVGVTLDGVADVANSLYAIKRLVYEEQRLSLDALRAVLRADWDGYEPLRQYVLNRLPRFGQDDPEVNEIARREAAHFAACFEGHETYYGDRFWPMIFGVTTSFLGHKAPKTGAMPSGRRAGDMLAQSLQPSPAGPQGCTTALLRSCATIDYGDFPGGISNVQECDPSLVAGEGGLDRLTDLVCGFLDLGGMELSLNFLSEEKLRAAQASPDQHRYLMVRVFGLSAQFVNLSPALQETVIERVAAASRRPAQ
jgi:formate C-acetyltransferase